MACRASSWRNAEPVALRLQHPDADARLGRLIDVLADLGQELGLDPRADDGGRLQKRPARGGRRPARASTASRTVEGMPAAPAASTSLTKNGLPPVWPVQGHRVDATVGHERAHRLGGERESGTRRIARPPVRSPSTRRSGWRAPSSVVAIGHHEQGRQLLDAPAEELHEVERRLVGPVQVLHDHHGRAGLVPERVEDRGEDGRARDLGVEQGAQRSRQRLGDVPQRSQRPRGEQGIARAPQHAGRVTVELGEALHERGLADARLAADQHHAPVPPAHLAESGAEGREHGLTLEKVHRFRPWADSTPGPSRLTGGRGRAMSRLDRFRGGPTMAVSQSDKAAAFRKLHEGPGAFVIPNPWDAGSARILTAHSGFPALATSSGASAGMLGRRDGKVTRDEALGHARAIVGGHRAAACPPISRSGFADAPDAAAETIRLAAGVGLRRRLDRGRHRRQGQAALRHRHGDGAGGGRGEVARSLPFQFTLTARTESFLRGNPEPGRRDRAAAGVRAGRRGRADGAGPARSRRGARGVRGGVEAGQLHGRHQGQVVHGGRAAGGRRAAHQPGHLALSHRP